MFMSRKALNYQDAVHFESTTVTFELSHQRVVTQKRRDGKLDGLSDLQTSLHVTVPQLRIQHRNRPQVATVIAYMAI